MKQTNLTLYLLCILCASFILFKCRASYGYSAAPVSAEITANDYALLRGPLKVIAEANLNPQSAKPLFYSPPGIGSTLPLAGLVGGAAGIAGLAYYQRTGVDPVYAAANAVASAADTMTKLIDEGHVYAKKLAEKGGKYIIDRETIDCFLNNGRVN